MKANVKIYNSNAEVYVDGNYYYVSGEYDGLTTQDVDDIVTDEISEICGQLGCNPQDIENIDYLKMILTIFLDGCRG